MIAVPRMMKSTFFIEHGGNDEDEDEDDCEYEEFYIAKAVLSCDPAHAPLGGYAMMVIYGDGKRLAVYQSVNKKWTFARTCYKLFHDVIFYRGRFHAVDIYGRVFSCALTTPNEVGMIVVAGPPYLHQNQHFHKYIVEAPNGELLQVWRSFRDLDTSGHGFSTAGFRVFRLSHSLGTCNWIEQGSIGHGAIFLGDNHSTCVSTLDFKDCNPNSIYFTDDGLESAGHKFNGSNFILRVYSMENTNITNFEKYSPNRKLISPAIWIAPTLPINTIDP